MKKTYIFQWLIASAFLVGAASEANAQARVQVIHNSAAPAADTVDVWLITGSNSQKLLDNFAFRTATPFVNLDAGVEHIIGIAGKNSTVVGDTIAGLSTRATLSNGQRYVLIAQGNVGSGFAPNPDAINSAFKLNVLTPAQESGTAGNVSLAVAHGAVDAPTVDIYVKGQSSPLVNNAKYGDITAYLPVPAATYVLDVTGANSTAPLFTYKLDLSGLGGGAAVAFASGYLNPAANNNGKSFGIFAALSNGTVVELKAPTTKLQAIHNSAAPAAATVDVYAVYGATTLKLIDDFQFRKATPYVDVPALSPLRVCVAPGNSSSIADTLGLSATFTLDTATSYVAIARGNVGTGFANNPNGVNTAFGFSVVAPARRTATNPSNVEFAVLHGSTDAPIVDVNARAVSKLVDNAKYTDVTSYISVPPATYKLDVTDSSGNTVLFTYDAVLGSLAGQTAVVFASGYVSPSANNNGPAFGLYAALNNGTVVAFSNTTSRRELEAGEINSTVYPNPSNGVFTVSLNMKRSAEARFSVYDLSGRMVYSATENMDQGLQNYKLDMDQLGKGVYTLMVQTEDFSSSNKLVLVK